MRKINENEFEQVSRQMLEIFFDEIDIQIAVKGVNTDTAKKVIYQNLYDDVEYFYKYGEVYTYDDEFSGLVFIIKGKKYSMFKKILQSLKSNKILLQIASKEEIKLLTSNAKKIQEVHSPNWFKKRKSPTLYLAHVGIAQAKRGQGIFREMMEFVFEYARKDYKEIAIETFNDKNVKIYEHFGFETITMLESADKSIKGYRMIKKL
jgi:ribosomal protein S18 acetylase RimI-like enzyme